ncbi:hypothetical protein H4W80_007898 [Nonomuraea angiospora]|uniref:Transposase n=1 Tax=Nonomuraea angiospora TaxID=46172 RepID=A0ABR9M9R4_9ACTN|nr:hypothetical protein [Nonomuraea angiospora]
MDSCDIWTGTKTWPHRLTPQRWAYQPVRTGLPDLAKA